jgi:uncharacterized membrane protein YesL
MSRQHAERELQNQLWEAYYRSIDLILLNLIWFVASLPVITAIPALGALFYATNRIVHDGSAGWGTFVEGFRQHFRLSWRWGLINAAILAFLGLSVHFYGQVDIPWLSWARWIIVVVIAVWVDLQLFTFPLLLEQADRRFLTATRNSMVLYARRPRMAVGALAPVLIIVVFSVLVFPPAWIFISASLPAYLLNRAVVNAIQGLDEQ